MTRDLQHAGVGRQRVKAGLARSKKTLSVGVRSARRRSEDGRSVSQSRDCSSYAEPRRFDVDLTGSIHFEEADNRRITHEGLSLRRQDQRPSAAQHLRVVQFL